MKKRLDHQSTGQPIKFTGWIYPSFALLFILFYRLVIDPRLIYHAQQPVFFYDWSFIASHFAYPAGPLELLSNFITQFYTNALLGSLLIAAVLLLLALGVRRLIASVCTCRLPNVEWLAVAPIAALHADYYFSIQNTLALALVICSFLLYRQMADEANSVVKTICFVLLISLIYYLAGAVALALLLLRIPELITRRTTDAVSVLLSFVIAPAIAQVISRVTAADPSTVFTLALPFMLNLKLILIYAGFWVILPAAWMIAALYKDRPRRLRVVIVSAAVLLFAGLAAFVTFRPHYRTVLRIQVLAQQRRWQSLLQVLENKRNLNHRLANFQRYRALYFTGQLGERLFEFAGEGADGLYRSDKRSYDFPLAYGDLLADLGNVNGALHKAYEAWAMEGETPRVLQRLAYWHLAKKEFVVAEKYLLKLKKSGKMQDWVKMHVSLCKNQSFGGSADLMRLNQFVERAGFLMRPGFAHAELKEIVAVQPGRKAIEYLLAYELLAGRLDSFMADLPLFLQLTPNLPRAFEEAVVLYLNSGLPVTKAQHAIGVRPTTVDSFGKFMQIMQKYGNDKHRAFGELQQRFGDSFWFYFLYLERGGAQ